MERSTGPEGRTQDKLWPSSSSRRSRFIRGKSEKDIINLREEINILKKLRHQNIILMLDWFETKSEFGVVTEYAQGELFEILEEDGKFSEEQIRKIAIQIAHALHYLHTNKIIHRDMKPQNILVGADGVVKLCDFGFARSMSSSSILLTSIKGTPLYMAPELVQEQPYNHSVDLWSFGIIIYELFAGQPPFFTNQLGTLIKLIIKQSIKYPPNMSKEFKSFLRGLLIKEPEKRMKWSDILEHPFLKKSNSYLEEEEIMLKRYNGWMEKLAYWNSEFKGLYFERTNIDEKNINASQISNLNETSYHEIINSINNQYYTDNKEKLSAINRMLDLMIEGLSSDGFRSSYKQDLVQVLNILNSVKNSDTNDVSFLSKYSKKFENNLNKILDWLLLRKNEEDCEFIYSIFGFYIHFGENSRMHENLKYLKPVLKCKNFANFSEKNFLSVMELTINLNRKILSNIKNITKITNLVKESKLIEKIFSVKVFQKSYIKNPMIIEKICDLIIPRNDDILTFPLLKETNITIKDNKVNKMDISALHEYSEYSQFYVFSCLENFEWLNLFNIDDINYLRLLLRFVRFSDECIKQLISNEKILKEIIKTKDQFFHKSEDLQDIFLQIYTEINKTKYIKVKLDLDQLSGLFSDKDPNSFLELLVFNYLTSLMDSNEFVFSLFNNKKSSGKFLLKTFKHIKYYINHSNKQDWKKIYIEDTINFGFIHLGYLDPVLKFLRQLLLKTRKSREMLIEFITQLSNNEIHSVVFGLFEHVTKNFAVSLKGLVLLFNFVVELLTVSKEHLLFVELLLKEKILRVILMFLNDDKNKASQDWPLKLGGSGIFDSCIKSSILRQLEMLLSALMKHHRPKLYKILMNQLRAFPQLAEKIVGIYNEMLKGSSDVMTIRSQANTRQVRATLIGLLMKTPELGGSIVKSFCRSGGLEFMQENGGLELDPEKDNNDLVLSDHLSILTQICLSSKDNYQAIHNLNLYNDIKRLMRSDVESIRERAARLVGQMCKNSDFFYTHIAQNGLIRNLIESCGDKVGMVRRSACLALGNAAFHNAKLYPQLEKCVPAVVGLLRDNDERTKTNAIGTINNLIRNSKELFPILIKFNVLKVFHDISIGKDTTVV